MDLGVRGQEFGVKGSWIWGLGLEVRVKGSGVWEWELEVRVEGFEFVV